LKMNKRVIAPNPSIDLPDNQGKIGTDIL